MVFCNSDYSNFIITGGKKEMKVLMCDRCKKVLNSSNYHFHSGDYSDLLENRYCLDLCDRCFNKLDLIISDFMKSEDIDFPNGGANNG